MSDQWIDSWLSAPRFHKYVTLCGNDRGRALAVYEWNVALGQALMRDIAHFEVALRNAYDAAFTAKWAGTDHWLLSPSSPVVMPIWRIKANRSGLKRGTDVNYVNRKAVDSAIHKCGGVSATAGKVIAELNFGFWRSLTTASHEKSIWVPYVHFAYPKGTSRSAVDSDLRDINVVRNRIAHREPIFDRHHNPTQEPRQIHATVVQLMQMFSSDAANHVSSTSTVMSVLAQRP
ncbi:hypothetical protein H7I87_22345 [Mycobacterium timonense]|uniref:Abi-like protein n=3 Tax=Mycobacterium TaxID=1763 RepID=A0AAW5S6R2_MYCBC|nr:hypothetical protein [Mycobacterium bouchedurhonense]MCV6997392.1 hypothetical protein [Mycobacterium timonense]ORA42018.1 hypothetical protein BST19_26705 [Mycobacterium bouchedurhonense]ORB77269.1 hypothetical protein BST46_25455 [Mycobacterium timonense]